MAIATDNTARGHDNLIRTDLWSQIVQEELEEELMGNTLVTFMTDFPDGDTIHVPTLASLTARTYTENDPISLDDPTVGDFTLEIDKYYQAGIAITDKMKEDTFYIQTVQSRFPEQVKRALMEQMETDIMELHKKQTTNDANTINGQAHRFDATGASQVITLADIAQAKLSLDKANVSKNGRVAIVDPTVSYQLVQIDNVIRQDVYGPNTTIKEGFGGTSFIGRYLGFDFFESNMLDQATDLDHATGGTDVANLFLGAEALIGAVRTTPEIEFFRQGERKRDVYHALIRYGLELFRKESLVCILTA